MTRKHKTVNCPYCSAKNNVILYESLNVTTEPNGDRIRESVMNGSFFGYLCHFCRHWVNICYPSLYLDEDRKLSCWIIPHNMREKMVPAIKKLKTPSDYECRIVFTPNELAEKIRIYNIEGYNDVYMEYLKIYAWDRYVNQGEDNDIEVESAIYDYDKMFGPSIAYITECRGKKRIARIKLTWTDFVDAKRELIGLTGSTPKVTGFETINLKWINDFIKNLKSDNKH